MNEDRQATVAWIEWVRARCGQSDTATLREYGAWLSEVYGEYQPFDSLCVQSFGVAPSAVRGQVRLLTRWVSGALDAAAQPQRDVEQLCRVVAAVVQCPLLQDIPNPAIRLVRPPPGWEPPVQSASSAARPRRR